MRKTIGLCGVLILAGGLFLVPTANLRAQRMGGGMGASSQGQMAGQQQPGMNSPGMAANMPNGMGRQNSLQANMERDFLGTMRRNNKAETEMSKLAVKNSSNDNVKKMAQQIIMENHRTGNSLNNAATTGNMPMVEDIPSQTKTAMKQMKKLQGTEFDKLYLSQMDGYIKNDQQTATKASSSMSTPDMRAMTMQLRTQADSRAQQLAQVAQSENFKIE